MSKIKAAAIVLVPLGVGFCLLYAIYTNYYLVSQKIRSGDIEFIVRHKYSIMENNYEVSIIISNFGKDLVGRRFLGARLGHIPTCTANVVHGRYCTLHFVGHPESSFAAVDLHTQNVWLSSIHERESAREIYKQLQMHGVTLSDYNNIVLKLEIE